jgi:uncharacterized protein (DUF1778 family)
MPNQRAVNKKQFGITLTKEEISRIDAAAREAGMTRTEFMRQAALAALKEIDNKENKANS